MIERALLTALVALSVLTIMSRMGGDLTSKLLATQVSADMQVETADFED